MENAANNTIRPSFGRSFGTGMEVMGKNFLALLAVVLLVGIVQAPVQALRIVVEIGGINVFVGIFSLFALAFIFLVVPVFDFGSSYIFVLAARGEKVDFKHLVSGFSDNYISIILANLLTFALVMIGTILLIIPGIIVSCRLAFVKFLVMDKKLDPIAAIEESWRLTAGHGWRIFAMGIVSFFIIIFGILMLIVGIFPAIIWVTSAFSVLYNDVLDEKGELEKAPATTN